MNHKHYLLSEKDSNLVFAVIKDIDADLISQANTKLINKVGQAIEEEFCYSERVKIVHDSIIETSGDSTQIEMSFRCIDEIEEEEIREFKLTLTTIY